MSDQAAGAGSSKVVAPDDERPRYIAIEGPIGVGKSTLAARLAEVLPARLVQEQAEDNPFLRRFYEDRNRWAFAAQTFFLLSRFHQQQELAQQNLFERNTVADYLFDKDRIFAHLNLGESELELYEQIFALLDLRLARPDLVVYLQARPKVLLERVQKRGRDYEKAIELSYLEELSAAYSDYFFYYAKTPLLTVNTNEIDFIGREEDFQELVKEIRDTKRGTQHFNPLGSG